MELDISPLCDRNTINIPQSQIGFITYIIEPTFALLSGTFYFLLRLKASETHFGPLKICVGESKFNLLIQKLQRLLLVNFYLLCLTKRKQWPEYQQKQDLKLLELHPSI